MRKMNKKIVSNFIYQAGYQLMMILLPIITIPIVSRTLGVQGLGTWNFIYSVVWYFTLIGGLGLSNYGVREIALVKKNKFALSKKFWELELFNAFLSLGVLVVYLVLCLFLPNKELYLILSITIFSAILDISWFFAGIEDFKRITLSNMCIRVISFLCIVIFVREREDLAIYFMIQAGTTFFSQALFWLFLKGKVVFVKVSMKSVWQHFRPSLHFFIAKLSSTIFGNLNKTLLGLMASMSIVGIYSNSLMLVLMASSLVHSLNIVMIPHMSNLMKGKDKQEMAVTLQKSIHIQFYFTIAIMFGIIATNYHLIGWFFGKEFEQMKLIVPILSLTVVFQSFYNAVSSNYLIPKGELKVYNKSIIIGACVSICIDLTLIPLIGIYGAVIGNLMGQFVVCIILGRLLLRETAFSFQVKQLTIYLLVAVVMALVIIFFTKSLPSTPLTTVLQFILGCILYIGLTIKISPLKGLLRNNT